MGFDPFTGIPLPPTPPQGVPGTPISQLPIAAALTGSELVPLLQNGSTVAVLLSILLGGESSMGPGSSPIVPVGASNIAANQIPNIGSAQPVLIVAARPGPQGTGRVNVTFQNQGGVACDIGPEGLAFGEGFTLSPGEAATFPSLAAFYGITEAGTTTIAYLETF